MAERAGEVRMVEVMRAFRTGGEGSFVVQPGRRVWAWKGASGWRVVFNGAEIAVPEGTVGDIDSAEVKQAAEERKSAREEEYQEAPSAKKRS